MKHRFVCIAGMPGVGKSTLAIKFGYHRSSSATVRFFKASSVLKLSEDYIGLAKDLQIEDENEEHRISRVNTKLTKLAETKQILFVFDNVDDYQFVDKYIRNLPIDVSVILTVRTKETIRLHEYVYFEELKPFSVEESTDYIEKVLGPTKITKEQIKKILEIIGYSYEVVPFHLNKVVSILLQPWESVEDHLKTIEQHPKKWLQTEFYDGFYNGNAVAKFLKKIPFIAQFCDGSMEKLIVAKILKYIPYFDPDSINVSLLAQMIDQEENENWNNALKILLKNFLIKKNKASKEISVHRLLQKELDE